jgi:hypothetical protein
MSITMNQEASITTEATMDNIATLPPTERAVLVLSSQKTEIALRDLVTESLAITDVIDTVGREQAHRLGMRLKSARTAIEKTGKSAREDAQAFSKAVISEEKRLIAITEAEERRVIALRDAYDARIEAEKRAKAAKVAQIQLMISHIKALPLDMAGAPSADIWAEIEVMQSFAPTEDVFGELIDECKSTAAETLTKLQELHARVLAQEVAQAKAEAAAAAERQRIEQARIEAERVMAEHLAMIASQRAAIEEEKRKAAEDLAAARAELAAERAAIAAERDKMEADRIAAMASAVATIEFLPAECDETDLFETVGHAEPINVDELAEPTVEEPVTTEVQEQAPAPMFVPYASWLVRQGAIHTSAQFMALAKKVDAVGFADFAIHLRAIAVELENGTHDAALTAADHDAIIEADNDLLDATIECIDAMKLTEAEKQAS